MVPVTECKHVRFLASENSNSELNNKRDIWIPFLQLSVESLARKVFRVSEKSYRQKKSAAGQRQPGWV